MRHKLFPLTALLLAAAWPALAHHSFTAEYDLRKPVTLHGSIVKFEMTNPHGWITVDVKSDAKEDVKGDDIKNDGGQSVQPPAPAPVRWMIQLSNPDILLRGGWKKDSLKPGDDVTVEAFQAKDGSHTAGAYVVTLPDGRKVFGGAPVAPADEQTTNPAK